MAFVDFSPYSFLLIDDFANYRSMLRAILRAGGATDIDDASNGKVALELMADKHYSVILCDYNLGDGQDGQQILEEAMHRKLLDYSTIFIMVTAENTKEMVMGAVEFHPDDYLSKPFPKEILHHRLVKILERKRAMKAIHDAADRADYDTALRLCDQGLSAHPKLAQEIGKLKGELSLDAGRYETAEKIYDTALAVRDFIWARIGKAKALMARGAHQEARQLLEAVMDKAGGYMELFDLLSEIHAREGDTDGAQQVLMEAVKLSPKAMSRQKQLAGLAVQNKDMAVAEKAFKETVRQGKYSYLGEVGDHIGLAKVYMEKGANKDALKTLGTAQKQYKQEPESVLHTRLIESQVHKANGEEDTARRIFRDAMKEMPEHAGKLAEGVMEDALETCDVMEEAELGEAIRQDMDAGEVGSEAARESARKYEYLLVNGEGIRLYETGRVRDSIDKFVEAAERLPDNAAVNLNAAQSLVVFMEKKGKQSDFLSRARHHLDVVRALDPGNQRYRKLEGRYKDLR